MNLAILVLIALPLLAAAENVHVVLSHYAEPAAEVIKFIDAIRRGLPPAYNVSGVSIVHKGDESREVLCAKFPGAEITVAANVGREGETYLSYLIERHGAYPDNVIFSQALPDEEGDFFRNLKTFAPGVQVATLAVTHDCTCDSCFLPIPRFRELYAIATRRLCRPEHLRTVFFRGQMIVSRRGLERQPVHVWTYLRSLLTAPPEHWIHEDSRVPGMVVINEEKNNNPLMLHELERLWMFLFGCTPENQEGPRCRG